MDAWDPNPDLEAAATLGEKLRAAGYTEDAIVSGLPPGRLAVTTSVG